MLQCHVDRDKAVHHAGRSSGGLSPLHSPLAREQGEAQRGQPQVAVHGYRAGVDQKVERPGNVTPAALETFGYSRR
jgi:hypothetical protein